MRRNDMNESQLIQALEMTFDGICLMCENGCILWCDCHVSSFSEMCCENSSHKISKKQSIISSGTEALFIAVKRSVRENKLIVVEEINMGEGIYYECRIAPYNNGALVFFLNITVRKAEKARLAESERSKAVFLSNLPGMAYRCLYDRDWTMTFVSDGCLELTGYSAENMIGNRDISYNDIINRGYQDAIWREWERVVAEKCLFRMEYPITRITGEKLWVFEQGQVIYDEQDNVEALEGIIIDVSARKDKESKINYLLTHDSLTGLFNRHFYMKKRAEMDASEELLPLSLIICDIDGLKLINDAFGTDKGDAFLQQTARLLTNSIREGDILARLGGDDFAILMPNTDNKSAEKQLQLMQERFNHYNLSASNDYDKIFLSMGCATKDYPDIEIYSVQKLAEENMNKRKLLNQKSLHSSIVESIKQSMNARSQETEAHAERLSEFSYEVGKKLQLNQAELSELELLATLHDIGKIGINDKILNKPGKLTDDEWVQMKKHTEIGYRIAMASPELISIADYILTHHERWDGRGYPQGLSGEQIPLISRILSVVDAYDAMTQDRIYRKAMPKEAAIQELKDNSGAQFDPEVVKVFLSVIEDLGD